ncbi:MAG TPA: hypothetical protein VF818_00170 [Ktedonobacterales bacterium]
MSSIVTLLGVAFVAGLGHADPCPAVPALSYAPADVGWWPIVLSALDLVAGVACIGIVGNVLRWSSDDRAPLRPLWMALIMLGFGTSAAGLYIAFANKAHTQAVDAWLIQASRFSRDCVASASMSPNITASTTMLSIKIGILALVIIVLGIAGAAIERRRGAAK